MKRKRGRQSKNSVKSESDNALNNNVTMNFDGVENVELENKLFTNISKFDYPEESQLNNEIEDVKNEIKEENCANNLTYSGRSQRIRKKPKRWEDDQVQVDFTGQSNLLILDENRSNKKHEDNKIEEIVRKRQKSQSKVIFY